LIKVWRFREDKGLPDVPSRGEDVEDSLSDGESAAHEDVLSKKEVMVYESHSSS